MIKEICLKKNWFLDEKEEAQVDEKNSNEVDEKEGEVLFTSWVGNIPPNFTRHDLEVLFSDFKFQVKFFHFDSPFFLNFFSQIKNTMKFL